MSNEYKDWMNDYGVCGDCIFCKGARCEKDVASYRKERCELFEDVSLYDNIDGED